MVKFARQNVIGRVSTEKQKLKVTGKTYRKPCNKKDWPTK